MHIPLDEFVPWKSARFPTEEARDQFLRAIPTRQKSKVEVKPMPDESRGALVRWLPGQFLDLNDLAYAHGGRIAVTTMRRRAKFSAMPGDDAA